MFLKHWSHLFSIWVGEDCPDSGIQDGIDDDLKEDDGVSSVGDSAEDRVDSTEDEDSPEAHWSMSFLKKPSMCGMQQWIRK